MSFNLGKRSRDQLATAHSDLALICREALEISSVDFAVHQAARSVVEQKAMVDAGVSFTMRSRHLKGGKPLRARAVDLVPFVDGKLSWEWEPIYSMMEALWQAASERELVNQLRWGGVWDRNFGQLDPFDLGGEVKRYAIRRSGRRVFQDGPHLELLAEFYP